LANNFIAREHNKDKEMLKRNAKTCSNFGSVIGGHCYPGIFFTLWFGGTFQNSGHYVVTDWKPNIEIWRYMIFFLTSGD
jgi:hypothetical protein